MECSFLKHLNSNCQETVEQKSCFSSSLIWPQIKGTVFQWESICLILISIAWWWKSVLVLQWYGIYGSWVMCQCNLSSTLLAMLGIHSLVALSLKSKFPKSFTFLNLSRVFTPFLEYNKYSTHILERNGWMNDFLIIVCVDTLWQSF